MDSEIERALAGLEPFLDLAIFELEMREHFQSGVGVTDAAKPRLYNFLIGDGGYDCD